MNWSVLLLIIHVKTVIFKSGSLSPVISTSSPDPVVDVNILVTSVAHHKTPPNPNEINDCCIDQTYGLFCLHVARNIEVIE
jgi:hypothetical protein